MRLLAGLTPADLRLWLGDWQFWARDDQLPPAGDWSIWLMIGGRGAG
jgi:phage terminase large subunit-like protein